MRPTEAPSSCQSARLSSLILRRMAEEYLQTIRLLLLPPLPSLLQKSPVPLLLLPNQRQLKLHRLLPKSRQLRRTQLQPRALLPQLALALLNPRLPHQLQRRPRQAQEPTTVLMLQSRRTLRSQEPKVTDSSSRNRQSSTITITSLS